VEVVADGERNRFGPTTHTELGVEVRKVGLNGAWADAKGVGDLGGRNLTRA